MKDQKLLEQAVIRLTIDNAKLTDELKTEKETSSFRAGLWQKEKEKRESLEEQFINNIKVTE